jgi:hypothetical protein
MNCGGLAEAHAKISANGKPKGISTFGFPSLVSLRNQNRQGNSYVEGMILEKTQRAGFTDPPARIFE